MYADITIKGYTFVNPKYDNEMEQFLSKLPKEQRQGVKSMLDFFHLHSKEAVIDFSRKYFLPKQHSNMVISAIINYMKTDAYQDERKQYNLYIRSKNYHPASTYKKMLRWQEYITSPLKLSESLFRKYKIRCEEDVEVLVGLKLFNNDNITVRSNFIDTALGEVFKEELQCLEN